MVKKKGNTKLLNSSSSWLRVCLLEGVLYIMVITKRFVFLVDDLYNFKESLKNTLNL